MPKDTVFQLSGQPQELIRKSYTGCAVDVYMIMKYYLIMM